MKRMTRKELFALLKEMDVPITLEGGFPDNAYTLAKTGKLFRPGKWEVYYSEKGGKYGSVFFDREEDACDYLYEIARRESCTGKKEADSETVFSSERIRFEEVSEARIPDYLAMINDNENVNRYLGKREKPFTEQEERNWVQKKREEKALVWSMIEKKSGEFIGNIELMDDSVSSKELGIAITAIKQDRGYGSEAILALLKYGFERLGLEKIVLRVHPANARAIHVYENCGFREYDRTEEHVFMEVHH